MEGRTGVQRGGGVQFSKAVERPVYTSENKRSGSDKNWKGLDKFLLVNDTWPIPVLPVPFKKGSIGAFFETGRIKIGSVPTLSIFNFQRVNARPLFGTDPSRFFLSLRPFYVSRLLQTSCVLCPTAPYIFAAKWRIKIGKLPHEKLQQKRLNLGKIMKSQCCLIRSFKNTSLSHRVHCYCA